MITINEETLREATLDGCDKADAEVYDQRIQEFLQYLTKEAELHGIQITCAETDPGTYCYSADTYQEHEFWAHSLDFWEWHEGKRCIYSFI